MVKANECTISQLKARIAVAEALIKSGETLAAEREDRNKERFGSMKTTVDAALASSDRAVTKAEMATEKRFEGVNEFRSALSDQSATLLPRSEYGVQHQGLIDRISAQDKTLAAMQLAINTINEHGAGKKEGIGYVGTIVLGTITAGALIVAAVSGILYH